MHSRGKRRACVPAGGKPLWGNCGSESVHYANGEAVRGITADGNETWRQVDLGRGRSFSVKKPKKNVQQSSSFFCGK
jgi:hypothetical protein